MSASLRSARSVACLAAALCALSSRSAAADNPAAAREAYNRGAAKTQGDWIVFCHDDIRFLRDELRLTSVKDGCSEGACGTCHVILEDQWLAITGNAKIDELQMLDMTPEKTSTSRLSCQIQVSDAMDGMMVQLPEFQM